MRNTAFCRESLRAADTLTCPAALQHTYGYFVCNLSVNPSVGSGDGDAVTDSFKDGVIHAVWVEVLVSGRPVGWSCSTRRRTPKA